MGTALTQEQLAELSRAAGAGGTVFLALDADRSGQEAMLRAARGARERDLELLVAGMPEGADPAELVGEKGAEEFESLLSGAVSVAEFEARRLLADADLGTPHGRQRALEGMRPLVHSVPANSVLRDHLVRFAADKLDVPVEFLTTEAATASAPAPARRNGDGAQPVALPTVEAVARTERVFLAMCLAEPQNGREYLERLEDDHFSSGPLRRVRDHLVAHFADPLAELPADDPSISALITDVAMRGQDEQPSPEALRLTFLQLELHRLDRQLRHAERDRDHELQRTLAPMRQIVSTQIDELMGQAE
jgi:DNA primase